MMKYLLAIIILGAFACGFCFGQDYQQTENSRVAREWKNYAFYVIDEAEKQCDAWRDRSESFEAALDRCNGFIKGKLTIEYKETPVD